MTERLFKMNDINTEMGFRLLRLEFVNWGTFSNGKVYTLDTSGKTSLITGANGSGKSTLVDALLTLLVPSQKRNYNLASGTERKRDRDEKTYIQGNYGKTTDDALGSKILKMREPSEGHISVLLAVYYSEEIKRYSTIAQVMWFNNGNLDKFYLVGEKELSIKEHFKHEGDIKQFKKHLRSQEGIKIFDSFKEYIHEFIKNVGLRSEKALDLFNQIVAIKSIGNLKEFIREHMLEKHDMNGRIEELDKNYKNLNDSYNAILQARKQMQELIPIDEEAKKYEQVLVEIQNIQGSIFVLPAFFSKEKISILKENLETSKFNLSKISISGRFKSSNSSRIFVSRSCATKISLVLAFSPSLGAGALSSSTFSLRRLNFSTSAPKLRSGLEISPEIAEKEIRNKNEKVDFIIDSLGDET